MAWSNYTDRQIKALRERGKMPDVLDPEYIKHCRRSWEFCFRNEYRIRTARHGDGGGYKLRKFNVNTSQATFHGIIRRQFRERGFARIICCKSRREGISTDIQALFTHMCQFSPETEALTMAHDKPGTEYLFNIGKRFVENCHPELGAPLVNKPKKGLIEWENGSTAVCQTQGGSVNVGRGTTPQLVHISELPAWDDGRSSTDAADVAQSVLNAVEDLPGTIVIIEATAKGVGNMFHRYWRRAERREPGFLFEPVFFTWIDNQKTFDVPNPDPRRHAEELELHRIMLEAFHAEDRVGYYDAAMQLCYAADWRERAVKYNLEPSQVRFGLSTKATKCDDDWDRFDSEWPMGAELAFISSGRPVFSGRAIQALKEKMLKHPPKRKLCTLRKPTSEEEDRFVWEQDGGGIGGGWEVYEWPIEGHEYLVIIDASSGGLTDDDNYAAVEVYDRVTWRQCAEYRCKIYPDILTAQAVYISQIYNRALLVPERNKDGMVVVTTLLTQYSDVTIWRRFVNTGEMPADHDEGRRAYGYDTNRQTKQYMYGLFEQKFRAGDLTLRSQRLLDEMQAIRRGKNGVPEAPKGENDDLCDCTAIFVDVALQLLDRGVPVIREAAEEPWRPDWHVTRAFESDIATGLERKDDPSWF